MLLSLQSHNVPNGQWLAKVTNIEIVDTQSAWLDSHPNSAKRQWKFTFEIDNEHHTQVVGYKFAWHGDARDREAMKWVSRMIGCEPDTMPDVDLEDLIGLQIGVECKTFTSRSVVVDVFPYEWL